MAFTNQTISNLDNVPSDLPKFDELIQFAVAFLSCKIKTKKLCIYYLQDDHFQSINIII